jgi:hypothetical protein
MSLGMNAVEVCPSEARRRHHASHSELCLVCEPLVEWASRCPLCLDWVTVIGMAVQPHEIEGRGRKIASFDCPGSGGLPKLVGRRILGVPEPASEVA